MTLRNMCAKVTPKPLNEPVNVPTSHLLGFGIAADGGGGAFGHRAAGPRARGYLQIYRGNREAARRAGGQLLFDRDLPRLAARRPEQRDRQDDDHDAADRQPLGAVGELAVRDLHVREEENPHQVDRDEDLPPEPHELVVAHPGQGGAQPDEAEQEDQDLEEEPDQPEPAGAGAVPDRGDRPRSPPPAEEERGAK